MNMSEATGDLYRIEPWVMQGRFANVGDDADESCQFYESSIKEALEQSATAETKKRLAASRAVEDLQVQGWWDPTCAPNTLRSVL